MKIENIHIDPPSHPDYWQTVALGWRTAEARYHVWIDKDFNIERGMWCREDHKTLYKNSLVERGKPGHFDTRRLDATNNANSKMVTEVVRVAKEQDLLGKALAECQHRENQRLAEAAAQHLVELKQEAGPALYDALKAMLDAYAPGSERFHRTAALCAVEMARAAIKKAEGK